MKSERRGWEIWTISQSHLRRDRTFAQGNLWRADRVVRPYGGRVRWRVEVGIDPYGKDHSRFCISFGRGEMRCRGSPVMGWVSHNSWEWSAGRSMRDLSSVP